MKPSIPKGTRDFLPAQIRKRKYIFDIIERTFKIYGYLPIETPTLENLSTLTGKYGEEGDKLLFKVLNNGDFLADANLDDLHNKNSNKVLTSISKRGLRYDLTVPFARFVVMHQNDITFPFKRYQIQPVWRADRPQRGRYQEFYQCDADVVGSPSLMYEAELVQMYATVLKWLNIKSKILINNRKILFGIAELANIPDQFMDMTMAIDKLDKIGIEGVKKELADRHIPDAAIAKILDCLSCGSLDALSLLFGNLPVGSLGISEVRTVLEYTADSVNNVAFDITLARGLNYYTGCIFEVKVDETYYPGFKMGSIGGGGRYDDLTGVFGLKDVSGVGISFGAERMYDVMEELNLFPDDLQRDIELLLVALDDETHKFAFRVATKLRAFGIYADIYPEPAKLKKQMAYANARMVPYVGIIGSEEMANDSLSLKNMATGDQRSIPVDNIIQMFS